MKKQIFRVEPDGFNGAWYPTFAPSERGLIIMLGDSSEDRLGRMPNDSTYESWLYEHGTHFVFPESILKRMLPVCSGLLVSLMFRAGKEHKKECRETRIDIDRRLKKALAEW